MWNAISLSQLDSWNTSQGKKLFFQYCTKQTKRASNYLVLRPPSSVLLFCLQVTRARPTNILNATTVLSPKVFFSGIPILSFYSIGYFYWRFNLESQICGFGFAFVIFRCLLVLLCPTVATFLFCLWWSFYFADTFGSTSTFTDGEGYLL